MGMMGGCMVGMGLLGLFGFAALLLLVIGLAWLVRGRGRGGPIAAAGHTAGEDRALAVLRERYARGEIDRAEYERRATLGERE